MSDKNEDEIPQNNQGSGKEKKKRTFVDATHILKAEAIRQLELKEQQFESEELQQKEDTGIAENRPSSQEESQIKEKDKHPEKLDSTKSSSKSRDTEGTDSLKNIDSDLKESTGSAGFESQYKIINNSEEGVSGLGDDLTIEKAKESAKEEENKSLSSGEVHGQVSHSKLNAIEENNKESIIDFEEKQKGSEKSTTLPEAGLDNSMVTKIVISDEGEPDQKPDLKKEQDELLANEKNHERASTEESQNESHLGDENKEKLKEENNAKSDQAEGTENKSEANISDNNQKLTEPNSIAPDSNFSKDKDKINDTGGDQNYEGLRTEDKPTSEGSRIEKILDKNSIESSASEGNMETHGTEKEVNKLDGIEQDGKSGHMVEEMKKDDIVVDKELDESESDSVQKDSNASASEVDGSEKETLSSAMEQNMTENSQLNANMKTTIDAGDSIAVKVDESGEIAAKNLIGSGEQQDDASDIKIEGKTENKEKDSNKPKDDEQLKEDEKLVIDSEVKENEGSNIIGTDKENGSQDTAENDAAKESEASGNVQEKKDGTTSHSKTDDAGFEKKQGRETEGGREEQTLHNDLKKETLSAEKEKKQENKKDDVKEKANGEGKNANLDSKEDAPVDGNKSNLNDGGGNTGEGGDKESNGDGNKEENRKDEANDEEKNEKDDADKEDGETGDNSHHEKRTVPKDFYYDYDEIVSKPKTTEGVPADVVNLYHSFGFECTKRSNMHMLDNENILFAAGNIVQILNMKLNKTEYIRSSGGGGIGAVAVHPSRKYFAIAEKGEMPNILIYEYPSLKVYRILREGTEQAYANLDFSPNGEKLASVGSAPDYMLTVWDWMNENIELRSKAFSQDVYKVAFSPENEGHLCTSGTGHIRFWTMATTFTGLKLQGELGRFGTTELSDIAGFVELPDGKVLSGSEWGNMLLWDGGLIKVEIARKGKKTCHNGMIEQFFLDEGELITIGIDGYVKVWDFESIDTAEAVDESKLFEMEPMSELKVGSDVKLVSMVKSVNQNEASIWYAQDAAGGIWKLDLSFSHTSQAPKRLFSFHAGPIKGLASSFVTHLSATVGHDHTVRLYDYLAKTQLCHSRFTAPGSSIIWMPKMVDPDGLSILAGFEDGVIRQLTVVNKDQTVAPSKKDTIKFEMKLTQVFKPHVKAVTSLAVSKDGKFLATGSEDSTVFFFSIDRKYKPIGFIETGGPVASLDWSCTQKKHTLLVCCKDGCVLEISCPNAEDYDTSKTYLIPLSGLKRTEFKFKSIKDKLVKEEEDLRKAKEEEEKRKQKEEEKRRKKERGIVEEEDDENEEDENEEDEERVETPKEEVFHEPGQIVNGFYKGDTGNFWLLLDGWDAGYIYECSFTNDDDVTAEPLKAIKFDEIDDVAVRSYCFSKTSQYMALGLDNGSIRVQILESRDINKLDSYWSLNMHDNHYGAVTNISLSFDEKFLLSVGNDGNFFVYSFMDEEKLKKLIGRAKADIAKKLESTKVARIDDIEDPNHYSIELEKQKAEHDRMVRLAEEKKQNTRQTVNLLRREFKRLVSRNQEMPPYLQLPPSEFIIDPNMKSDIDAETKEKLNLVEKEMAWESEKNLLSLRKLEARFKDTIECELFKLHAFNTQHSVMSYRATVFPPEFNEALEENKNRIKTAENDAGGATFSKRLSVLPKKMRALSRDESTHEGTDNAIQSKKSKPAQKLDGKIAKAIEKAEQNKKRRLERKAKWDELYRSKPDLDYEDPENVAAIKEAQENMGDFKLKSADDYIVPEKERVNADKKRNQIVQLKEQIHQLKRNFNEKLLNLRDRKIFIIAEVQTLTDQLENVQNSLPLSKHIAIPPVPVMQPDEQPETLFEYTSEILSKFKKELNDNEENLKATTSGSFGGGFGGFGGGEQTQPTAKITSQLASTRTEQRGRSTSILSTLSSQPRSTSSIGIDHGSPETISEEVNIDEEPSDMEMKVRDEQRIRLIYERDVLLQKIKDLLIAFDAELRILRHEKIHLDVDLKNADLRMITLFEELVLLKEFEKRENVLMGKVLIKVQEKDDMEEKVEDCQIKLQLKKEEIEKLQEKEKSLSTVFSNLFLESNKFEAFLTKVYKKKIKRVKKTDQDAGSDEESDDDLSDDDYDSEEDEDSDAEELDDSVCPPGCDQALFDQVCQLREKRLDLEEATVEEKKAADTLKKELDALKKKAKIIESNLVSAESELEAFQREKQQKLNELDIVVTMKLSQLQYLNNNALPQDLSQCLVFTSTSLEGLQRRITELDKEKGEQKKLYWKLRQQHVTLIRDKKGMEEKIRQLEEKVQQMQLLKFGRLVDLEKLETVSVNRAAEELKEQLRSQEFSNAKEIAVWEKRIDDAKAKLTQVTRENTQRLDTCTVLLQEKKELEQTLDSRQKNLGSEFQGNRKADYQERQRLVQLVQLQSQEIDALKEEIGLLSRKGGHILPPSQAPASNATTATH